MYIAFYKLKSNTYVWKYFLYIKIWYVFLTDINTNKYSIDCHRNIAFHLYVTGGKNSSLNPDSNPGPLAFCASTLTTELLRPDI